MRYVSPLASEIIRVPLHTGERIPCSVGIALAVAASGSTSFDRAALRQAVRERIRERLQGPGTKTNRQQRRCLRGLHRWNEGYADGRDMGARCLCCGAFEE